MLSDAYRNLYQPPECLILQSVILMEYEELSCEAQIPILGLGTWGVGGRETADYSRDEEEVSALQAGIEIGFSHIDTAEVYGAGHSEELVGEAVKAFQREKLFIVTKVWHKKLGYDELVSAMKASLRRLDLDYVDLYLVHWPNPRIPLKETVRGLEHCVEQGYTRFIGVSNFSSSLLAEAQSYLKEHRLVANQVEYSLIYQNPKVELLPNCQSKDVTLIAYTPLAKGRLAKPGNRTLDEMADKYGKTPAQISLNWLISQKKVAAIPKASKIEHLEDNIGALGWKLKREDSDRVERAFA